MGDDGGPGDGPDAGAGSTVIVLLLACVERSAERAPVDAPDPAAAPPVVVDAAPGCDTPGACAGACDAGGAVACNLLGSWLQDGLAGAAKDPVAAAARYERACDLGAGIGCYNLAHQKSGGQGIPPDLAGASALLARTLAAYRASCDAGGLVWCSHLAGLHQRGEGVPKDPAAARALYAPTCEGGDALACLELASMMQNGEGGPGDPAAAETLLRDACDRGVALSCRNLALRTEDTAAALALLIRACEAPTGVDGLSCAMAGDLLLATPDGQAAALPRFERACSAGVAPACLEVVRLASLGHAPMTPEQALPFVERGCSLGDPDACAVLAQVRSAGGTP